MDFKKILRETLTIKFDKAFGLDIGDRSAEIIELDKIFKFSVVTYGRTELPEGVVENGKIMNQAVLAEKIKNLLKEARPKKVSTNKVIVSLPESQIFIECFEIDSHLKSGALVKAISDKMSLSLPINIEKTYWDFTEKSLADRTKKLIMFISVPKDIANSYVKFCNSIGLEVVSLSTESLSLARILLKSSSKHSLIIDIGSQATNLSFFDGDDEINMSTTIPVAGEQMTLVVKNGLKIEKVEAEALKVKFGFKESAENVVRPIILPVIEDLSKEIKLAIEYYEMTFKQKLDNIYIIGGSALLPAITDILKVNLGREVKIAIGSYDINLSSITGKSNPFPLFANVIGLGMLGASGQFKDMNLLKKMPNSEINLVNKLDLLKLGYLSKTNTIRTIINNRYVMVLAVILIIIIFFVLLQITRNFGLPVDSATYF
ncbi:MAG: pilus assembly protein PilM [bacterium]